MSNTAFFMDGQSSERKAVSLCFSGLDLLILQDRGVLAAWPLEKIRQLDSPADIMLLGLSIEDVHLQRLDVKDTYWQAEIRRSCPYLDDLAETSGRTGKLIGWSLAATLSIALLLFVVIPNMAERLTPFISADFEKRFGESVDMQVRLLFSKSDVCRAGEGEVALQKLSSQLVGQKSFVIQPEIAVLDNPLENAFALPGGKVYLFKGLLEKAQSSDEVAGVIAHEYGHVYHRDVLRATLKNGGTSFLIGLFFGDVTGGSSMTFLTQMLINNSYSRNVERQADAFSAETMLALGRDPATMAQLLSRIGKGEESRSFLEWISTHPDTKERLASQSAMRGRMNGTSRPLLTEGEWKALKDICKK